MTDHDKPGDTTPPPHGEPDRPAPASGAGAPAPQPDRPTEPGPEPTRPAHAGADGGPDQTTGPGADQPGDQPTARTPDQPADQPADQPDEPGGAAAEPAGPPPPGAEAAGPPRRGQIRYQDPSVTRPREPSLAEKRARQRAVAQEREAELAARAEAERKATVRRRVLIGSGVTVGVVALVAIWYAAASTEEVTAQCTRDDGTIVEEQYCDESYYSSHGGYHSGGFIYIGGTGYRYNYGGTGAVGQKVSGGTYTAPDSGTTVKTQSGKTVQRGGFGVSNSGKSGGS
ncbi:hypothetical protein [Goodfellowiella coeruleoviolacea]|uniref:Uncharacterized protein n=1 Tax=Goodfellowiella coeruleoviolacea TaxID=334858 RepID=A0AAE3GA88_9PSEU|nr:hypothetical protein [Goodfellowiella coeruleoviolacea]MCP2164380.1 hypothetical protein [Goodfellowiella coeruleoviolacea]